MPRHDFQPGRLVAGLFLTLTGVVYLGDAGGLWDSPWFVAVPLVVGGLWLAGVAAFTARAIRRRRRPQPARPPTPTVVPAPADPPPGGDHPNHGSPKGS